MRRIMVTALSLICTAFLLSACSANETYVEDREMTLTFSFGERTGVYTGDVQEGIPEGSGTFESVNDSNVKWIYTGSWKQGVMDGEGICEWEDNTKYDGEYKEGLRDGHGSWYEKGTLIYSGTWSEGELLSLDRDTIVVADDEPKQLVQMGKIGFQIPETWEYEVIDNNTATRITIPNTSNLGIIYSLGSNIDVSVEEDREVVKQLYLNEYGNNYSEYMLVSEEYSNNEYTLHYSFYEGNSILDIYSHAITRNYGTYILTVGHFDIGDNYFEATMCIPQTTKLWEYHLKDMEEQVVENTETQENIPPIEDTELSVPNEDLSKIKVTFEKDYVDGDRLHLKVYVNNNSDKTFTGDVHVFFYSRDGKDRLGSDMIIVEDLAPGRQSWANVTIDKYDGTPQLELEFTDPTFTEVEEITAEVDNDATEKTKSSYKLNFEGVSWYEDITDIVVYTDGNCVVTIKNDSKEKGQFYASTVWSCGNDHGVETVQVIDSDGNIKSVYP